MNLLLDTHIWLRWLSSDQPLSETLRALLEDADQLAVSAVSCWEVAYLAKKGRIKLPLSIFDWIHFASTGSGVKVISVSSEIAVLSAELPEIHRDPADRFIIATASICDCKLVSFDEKIRQYDCIKNLLVTDNS